MRSSRQPRSNNRILVQPRDGVAPVLALIEGAAVSIGIKMFTFTAQALLQALIAAAARGSRFA